MKKFFLTMLLVSAFFTASAASASAVVNDVAKVGLKYGSNALFSANLENHVGHGYAFGYFDDDRDFVELGETDEKTISMTAAGTVYMNSSGTYSPDSGKTVMGPWRIQIEEFDSFEEAEEVALELGGWPAWIDEMYVVRLGCFESEEEAEEALMSYLPQEEEEEPAEDVAEVPVTEDAESDTDAASVEEVSDEVLQEGEVLEEALVTMSRPEYEMYVVECTSTGIIVTETGTDNILFEYDCWGVLPFGVMPDGEGKDAVTWFKGYKYYGGFEYARITGGDLNVCNLVDLEDYVKGVIPHEMSSSWPEEALKAQAVCARTYAINTTKHLSANGFDVCNTNDCQVYYGVNGSNDRTDNAVEETAGECLRYKGKLAGQAVYHSSNGGATEDVKNIWGGDVPYLMGKEDPYEALISIPNYNWSVTYTAKELTWILEQKGYNVGTVKNVYVSEYTPLGNVKKLTIEGSKKTQTVSGNTCSTIFYSSTYGKSVKSMRFSVNGGGPSGEKNICINTKDNKFSTLKDIAVIFGSGEILKMDGRTVSVLSADGLSELVSSGTSNQTASKGEFLIEGSGSGHNVGMSQYGAKAMAENGYDYDEILEFYYTGIEVY